MSSTSCLWGGQPDQLPFGVNTSQMSSRSAGKPGIMMLLTWRVAFPAPRTSALLLQADAVPVMSPLSQ
jgi:hypothetical protein